MGNSKSFWRQIKSLTEKPIQQTNIRLDQWYVHFKSLFAPPVSSQESYDDVISILQKGNTGSECDYFNTPITDEEIEATIKQLNFNKSVSGDLTPQHFAFSMPAILPFMRKLMNRLFSRGEFPDSWTKSVLVPLHKNGNVNSPDNYRGIAIMDVMCKIYIAIITKRISFFTDAFSKISEAQAGFRSGYSTIDNAFVLSSLISKCLAMKRKFVYVAFIDFKKAFDSVEREILFKILSNQGSKGNLINAVRSIYKSVKAVVKTKTAKTSSHENNVAFSYTDAFDCPIGLRQGCSLSPILFILFINELSRIFELKGIRGIQLYPDSVEITHLMFADDVAFVSDTIVGLQRQLNILETFCRTYSLTVNVQKTKVVVFKKGGHISQREKWFYNGTQLETVNQFCYVGVCFTNRLSLYKMAENMCDKAKRVLNHLFNSFGELKNIPFKTFFKVFDCKVSSIALYGSEIWGLKEMACIENLQTYACKRFLNATNGTCNDVILGDLGRYPMYIYTVKSCLSYWIRILKLPDTRYAKCCYKMLKHYDAIGYSNWVTDIRCLLYKNGFGYVWESQNVANKNQFIYVFINRLKDQFIQTWRSRVVSNIKLHYYIEYKHSFGLEKYVTSIDILKFRKALLQFRSSSHNLMVETGRYFGIAREDRICLYCESGLEDEFHFLFICALYESLRIMYIPHFILEHRTTLAFGNLMSNENDSIIRNLAMYLYYAFEKRHDFLLGRM